MIAVNKNNKLLKLIINYWFVFTIVMTIISLIRSVNYDIAIGSLVINLIGIGGYYVVVFNNLYLQPSKYNTRRLVFIVFSFSLFFLLIFKSYYYYNTGAFFEFSAKDSLQYDLKARVILEKGFIEGFKYLFIFTELADFGAIISVACAYFIYPSTFVFNILNIVAGIITTTSIFKLLRSIISNNQYAFLCALVFSISSFSVYMYSTGMKESIFIMFVVLFFEKINLYFKSNRFIFLLLAILFLTSLLLFRPAVFTFALFSLPVGILLSRKRGINSIFFLCIVFVFLIYSASFFEELLETLAKLTDNSVLEEKQNLSATNFNFLAALLSSLVGPIPTYVPFVGSEQQAFYSIGIGFRVFISMFFLEGLYTGFRRKEIIIIAMGVFTILEMLTLASILESFELRLNSPHLVPVYILAFYGIYFRKTTRYKAKLNIAYLIGLSLIIIFWNLRY